MTGTETIPGQEGECFNGEDAGAGRAEWGQCAGEVGVPGLWACAVPHGIHQLQVATEYGTCV